MDKPLSDSQIQAERSHDLTELIHELGGLAHPDQETAELDKVLDNMLSKGFPSDPSPNLQRWIHTHRNVKSLRVHGILGAHVSKASSIIPECFGKYHDPDAAECKVCLDRTLCSMKMGNKSGPVTTSYGINSASSQSILKVLQGKTGQVARTLFHGNEVVLRVESNRLKLLSVSSPNQNDTGQALEEKDNMANKKGAPATASKKPSAAAVIDEEEVDLNLTDEVEEEVEGEEEVDEGEGEGEEEAEAPAPTPKPKKEKKPKAPLTPSQKKFQDHLDGLKDSAEKQKYSAKIAKDMKVKVEPKNDDRIDHMLRCMAIKKALGELDHKAKGKK
jgi:hypothetical protein